MKFKRKLRISPLVALLPCTILLLTSPAQGSLIGDTVTCAGAGQISSCSQLSAVVGAGVEFTFGNALPGGTQFFSVDYGASDVVFTVLNFYASFGSIVFSSTDTTHAFTSDSLISVAGFSGSFSASNISLSGATLMVTLSGTTGNIGDTFDVGLGVTPVTTTPEPASTALVGVGSILVIAWRRKSKRTN